MTLEGLLKYPIAFLLAACVSYILTPFCITWATKLGIVDIPGNRRIHNQTVARAGGIAVFAGLHVTAAFLFHYPWIKDFGGTIDHDWWELLLGASSLLLIVGLLDDAFQINWFVKLSGQALAAYIMYEGGVSFDKIQGYELPAWLDMLLTIGWFLAFVNAFNLIDGLDGLASGLAAIASMGLAIASMFRGMPADALLLLALSGACVGFLRYNFHPAKIFLGDSGSMILGFSIAAMGLVGTGKSTTLVAIGIPFLAIGVPAFDVLLAIWRRSVKAIAEKDKVVGKVVHADMEHIHHRLLKAGLNQRKVALTLYAINAVLVTLGLLTVVFNSRSTGIFLLALMVGTYVVVKHLAQIELWDSGKAILTGMRRPGRRMLPAMLYPIIDGMLLLGSLAVVTALVFKPESISEFRAVYSVRIPVWSGVPFIVIALAGVYNRVWSRARPSEFGMLGIALIAAFSLCFAVRLIVDPLNASRSMLIAIAHGGLSLTLILGIRTLPRLIQDLMVTAINPRQAAEDGGILIYGAGTRGLLYLRRRSYKNEQDFTCKRVLGFIDDDTGLRKRKVHGHLVYGGWEDLTATIEALKPCELVVTCTLEDARIQKLIEYCSARQIRLVEWQPQERVLSEGDAESPLQERQGAA